MKQQYFFIDELQEIISRNVGPFYKQCRDRGITIIGALQQQADLKQHPVDLAPAVIGNSRFRITLSVKDDAGIKYVINTSGKVKKVRYSRSTTKGPKGTSEGVVEQEYEDTAITIDDIHRLNNAPGLAVLDISPGDGFGHFTRPTMIRLDFVIGRDEYEDLKALPWPCPDGWTPPGEEQLQEAKVREEADNAELKSILDRLGE